VDHEVLVPLSRAVARRVALAAILAGVLALVDRRATLSPASKPALGLGRAIAHSAATEG
jgi:hypothetical protein